MYALFCNKVQSPRTFSTRSEAIGAAKFYARKFQRTVTVVEVKVEQVEPNDGDSEFPYGDGSDALAKFDTPTHCRQITRKGNFCSRTAKYDGFCKQHA